MTRERADVLVLDALRAGARGDQCDSARHASSASSSRPSSTGAGTPSRCAARTAAPVIASSSDGRPAAMSRAVDEVSAGGIASMISHCAAGVSSTPSARATRQVSSTASSRRRRHAGSLRSSPIGRWVSAVAAATRRLPRELLPQHRLLAPVDANLGTRPPQELGRLVAGVRGDRHHACAVCSARSRPGAPARLR